MKSFFLFLLFIAGAASADPIYQFNSPTDRARFEQFTEELRCPHCQNQNLAGSDSLIAEDLRREIYEQIQDGRSDKEITDYMVARYGDFILYRPPFNRATAVLYAAPVVCLIIGVVILLLVVRRRRQGGNVQGDDMPLSAAEQARIDSLLSQEDKS